ncbi:hypothetical protein BDV26DRAFT_268590 [Aspergillus bertholletiae]|uniref:Uncharacterized protein n=1 Tax=Aspergillus bertholletiae TaxID=1226010 RepID=A0A5N7AYZ2_9EURO|nr:hypothetical protein BDV26DRAFT_268590 [Aspergillus bertholletiae]
MWKLFAIAYPVEFWQISQYRSMKIEGPRLAMRDYLELVKSDSLKWRLVLSLATSFARVPELVEIASIRNMVALEVATPSRVGTPADATEMPVALSDRIIRSWSELVWTSDAFSHLRVLKLCHQDLSAVVLRYLRAFPSLQVIVAYGCPGIHSLFTDGLEIDGWESRPGQEDKPPALYELYQTSIANTDGESLALGQGVPILDFQIGQAIQKPKKVPTEAKTLYLYRTTAANLTEKPVLHIPTKRPREGVSASGEYYPRRSGPKRAVMRDRKAKDLGEVLGKFL